MDKEKQLGELINFGDLDVQVHRRLVEKGWVYDEANEVWYIGDSPDEDDISQLVLDLFDIYMDTLPEEYVPKEVSRDDAVWHLIKLTLGEENEVDLSLIRTLKDEE